MRMQATGANLYTDLNALNAVAGNDLYMADGRTMRATTSNVDVPQNQIDVLTFELGQYEAGMVLLADGGTTIGLPTPTLGGPLGGSNIGDTYVIINIGNAFGGSNADITIDRSGLAAQNGHGIPQNLNGAATNGALPVHEAVTLIYVDPGIGWYGIGL